MEKKKPHGFTARNEPFKVQIKIPSAVTGYTEGEKYASYYRPIPVKEGDVFKVAPGGIILNCTFVPRAARPLRKMTWKVSWVAKRLRMAVFQERDRLWSKKTGKFTKKLGKLYWTACDLRSYHVGCADSVDQAIKNLILQCQATNLGAEEERAKGNSVIRWRCLLPKNEVAEMEEKARKTGFILDGVEVPPLPAKWQKGLEKLRAARK